MTEGLSLASGAKTTVAENATSGKALNAGWTAPAATANVASVAVAQATGVITVTMTAAAKGVVLTLSPQSGGAAIAEGTIPDDRINWVCAVSNAANDKYVPAECRA